MPEFRSGRSAAGAARSLGGRGRRVHRSNAWADGAEPAARARGPTCWRRTRAPCRASAAPFAAPAGAAAAAAARSLDVGCWCSVAGAWGRAACAPRRVPARRPRSRFANGSWSWRTGGHGSSRTNFSTVSTVNTLPGPLDRASRSLKLVVRARAPVRPRRCGPKLCGGSHRFYHGRRDRTRPPVLSESTRRRARHLFIRSPCAFSRSLLATIAQRSTYNF